MKRISAALLAALTLVVSVPAASAAPAETGGALDLACASALLMEKETGTVLYEKDAHAKLEPASVTKVMTMLLVMEAVNAGKRSPPPSPSPAATPPAARASRPI